MKTETVKRPLTLFEKIEFFDRKLRNGNAFPADEREGQKLLAICNAAPELLEACKRISANSYGIALGDLEFLNKAIAKVEGKV